MPAAKLTPHLSIRSAGHELREDEQQADQKRLLLERFQEEVRCRTAFLLSVGLCLYLL